MPELPEVETIKNDLADKLSSKQVKGIEVRKKNSVKNDKDFFIGRLKNSKIKSLDRAGKLVIIELAKSGKIFYLIIHLKMTGQLIYCSEKEMAAGGHIESNQEKKAEEIGARKTFCHPTAHTRAIIELSDDSSLLFNDMRRFGYLQIVDKTKLEEIRSRYGINPLGSGMTAANLKSAFKNRKASVKAALLNQQLIAGIGNIYADEILFDAGIRPDKSARSLASEEYKALARSVKNILKKAIKHRGTTFKDYLDGSGQQGNFSDLLKVYGRGGDKCLACGTTLEKTKIAQRGTVYCPHCQK